MNYIQTKLDGHQVDIAKDDYSLRNLIARGWSVIGILDAGDKDDARFVVARPYDASNAERDAAITDAESARRKAEAEAYDLKRKHDAALARIGELTQQLAEATAALAPRFDVEV